MGQFNPQTDLAQRHLKVGTDSTAGVFAGDDTAGVYNNKNGVVAGQAGVGIMGATHLMATPESIRFSVLYTPNPAAIIPNMPAYIMAGPPIQGPAYMAREMGMFAALTAASVSISTAMAV